VAVPVVASSSSDAVTGTGDTDLAPAAPTSTAVGDLLLAALVCDASRTYSAPAGWTTVMDVAGGTERLYWFAKVAASGDTSGTYTFTASAGFNSGRVWVGRLTGATATIGDLVADAGPGNSGTDATAECQNVTTVSADNLVLYAAGTNAASSSLAGWTEEYDAAGANTYQLGVYSKGFAASGLVTGPTISISFTTWTTAGVAIPPAGGGGGGSTAVTAWFVA
jgi:hypothetical protein